MQRFRRPAKARLAAVAVLTLCAGLALAGCRSQPGVAAYVGDQTLTEGQIDSMIDEINANKTGEQAAPPRTDVVSTFVLTRACQLLQQKQNFHTQQVSAAEVQQAENIPANTEFARLRAEFRGCVVGISPDTEGKATDAELQAVFDRAVKNGLINPTASFAEVKDQLATAPQVTQGIAFLHPLTQMMNDGKVSVNPRYRPLEINLSYVQDQSGRNIPLVVMTLGEAGSDAVRPGSTATPKS